MKPNRTSVGATSKKKIKGSNFLIREPSFEWSEKQKEILDTMNDSKTDCVILNGLAGSGKTSLAVYSALQHLQRGMIDKIIYIRTAVEAGHAKLGFMPGDLDEKFAGYVIPLQQKLLDFLNPNEVDQFIKDGRIMGMPIAFLRGQDLKDSIVILDEAQQNYLPENITVASRISTGSKLFILADDDQCDLPKAGQGEFQKLVDMFSDEDSKANHIHYYEMKDDMDIMRSGFVKYISVKYKNYKKSLK